jgi:hypothetical protein
VLQAPVQRRVSRQPSVCASEPYGVPFLRLEWADACPGSGVTRDPDNRAVCGAPEGRLER